MDQTTKFLHFIMLPLGKIFCNSKFAFYFYAQIKSVHNGFNMHQCALVRSIEFVSVGTSLFDMLRINDKL